MNTKSRILAATTLALSALVMAPGLNSVAHASDASAVFTHQSASDMLVGSAFGISVGTGRGVRVGVVVGKQKSVAPRRKVLVGRYR